MGQREIIDWLKCQREKGNNKYFSIEEIRIGLNKNNKNSWLNKDVNTLFRFGFLECRTEGIIERYSRRKFRLKHIYCSDDKKYSFK